MYGNDDVSTAAANAAAMAAAPAADVEVPMITSMVAYGGVPVVCSARKPASARRAAVHALVAMLACAMPEAMAAAEAEALAGDPALMVTAPRGSPARFA